MVLWISIRGNIASVIFYSLKIAIIISKICIFTNHTSSCVTKRLNIENIKVYSACVSITIYKTLLSHIFTTRGRVSPYTHISRFSLVAV